MLSRLRLHIYDWLPVDLREAIVVRRRSPFWLRSGIVFVHIPKAAGTAINLALYGRFMGHIPAKAIRRWGSADVNALPSFAVARNPWDRLVSAYRFARRGGGVGGAEQAGVWKPEQYRVPEFSSFDRFVTEWLARRDPNELSYHFKPQWPFVCDQSGRLLVDHLGRVEDLAPTLDFVKSRIGLVPELSKANRSGESVDYRSFYTPDLVELVGRIYARDVEIFGYSFEG